MNAKKVNHLGKQFDLLIVMLIDVKALLGMNFICCLCRGVEDVRHMFVDSSLCHAYAG
jgi:hypothetical protein